MMLDLAEICVQVTILSKDLISQVLFRENNNLPKMGEISLRKEKVTLTSLKHLPKVTNICKSSVQGHIDICQHLFRVANIC